MIDPMIKEYNRELEKIMRPYVTQDESLTTTLARALSGLGKKWSSRFGKEAHRLTDELIGRTDRYSKKSLNASLKEMSGGLNIGTPDMPQGLYDRLLASTQENVLLIKSIPQEFHERIRESVMRSIQTDGFGSKTLLDEINQTNKVTKNRAELIAVDQTRKVNAAMNTERMKSVGVEKFEWIHSGGGAEPRELHLMYDGQIFEMENPPVIDDRTGERGFPGQLINCRCKMRPVVDFTQYLED